MRLFREIGVEVNSPFEPIDFNTVDYTLMLSIRFAMAEAESNKISERTKDGINQSNRKGYFTGTAPFGYKRQETHHRTLTGKKRKILNPDENAPIVKEIYRRFIDGEERGELFKEYSNKVGIKRTNFYRLFENPIYMGFIDVKGSSHFLHRELKENIKP